MRIIEKQASKVEQAIEEALKELNATYDEVKIEVLNSGGFLRKAKIRATLLVEKEEAKPVENAESKKEAVLPVEKQEPKHEAVAKQTFGQAPDKRVNEKRDNEKRVNEKRDNEKRANDKRDNEKRGERRSNDNRNARVDERKTERKPREAAKVVFEFMPQDAEAVDDEVVEFFKRTISLMQAECEIVAKKKDKRLYIECNCENGAIIGHRGETLDSLEVVTAAAAHSLKGGYDSVSIDCNGYRVQRLRTLEAMAHRMADKAVRLGRKVRLEPMNNASRKVIHSVLQEDKRIMTRSQGDEPRRYVVIYPKRDGADRAEQTDTQAE